MKRRRTRWGSKETRRWARFAEAIAREDPAALKKYRKLTEKQLFLLDRAIDDGWRPPFSKIEIFCREWHRRSYGGMYHRFRVYFDGKLVHTSPIRGMSASQQGGDDWLWREGWIPRHEYARNWWPKYGVAYHYYEEEVRRERDL